MKVIFNTYLQEYTSIRETTSVLTIREIEISDSTFVCYESDR